ncbi:hypothetical protein DFQ26_003161 [Actinomortierella ambigua]|nr:hypothetical protein DFQ26_003161 [Actinomortierella ambigua]
MTSITPITTNTTTSTPHGTPTLSLRSNRGEAKRIRGQNRRLTTAQPRKSLADLLFEAQSHYISHRYPQALALYLEAVCEHESVQACNSLYALYTAAKQERGLVRSDTRATRALIHALQIWARKRWPQANVSSDPIVSSLMNLEPLLQTIYATCEQQQSPTNHTHSQPTSPTSASSSEEKSRRRDLIESFFADGSSRFWRRGQMESRSQDSGESAHHHSRQGAMTDDNLALGGESEDDDESGSEISGSGESDDDGDESDVESFLDGEDDSDADSSEEELDPEQRGQATGEIEDIVQRLCQMIQKGVLGLDEPIVLDAIAMLQWIAHELASEADEHHKQERQESLLQQSSLGAIAPTGSPREFISGKSQDDADLQASPGLLLLIQPLQFSDADDEVASTANSVKRGSSPAPSRPLRHSTTSSVRSGSHHRGANLTPGQQALDLTFCRAMRIRIMSMLGWVHHQRHEYKYGAQAYAVCSEIMPKTGRIQVDTLQRKAAELMRHCQEMDLQQKRDAAGTSTSCSSGASINSIHSSSATLYQAFDISTPSTISTTETNSVCPLSAEGDHNSASTQQHHHVMASDAQVLEAAIRIASLAMESRRKPTVYEGAPVLAAEREARRASAHEEDPAPPLPSPTSSTASSTPKTHVKDEGYHQSPSFSRSVGSSKSRRSRSRSRGRVSADGSIKGYAQNSRALRIQTEPSLLSKTESRLTQVVTTGATSSSLFSRRPALGGHAHSMPQLQPSHHYHHLHHHHHRHLHHPKVQQPNRPKASGLVFGQPPKNPTQVTLSTCGHCGKKGTQMPLCVCKTTRYCNRDCRVADMEAHRATGCHAALIGGI